MAFKTQSLGNLRYTDSPNLHWFAVILKLYPLYEWIIYSFLLVEGSLRGGRLQRLTDSYGPRYLSGYSFVSPCPGISQPRRFPCCLRFLHFIEIRTAIRQMGTKCTFRNVSVAMSLFGTDFTGGGGWVLVWNSNLEFPRVEPLNINVLRASSCIGNSEIVRPHSLKCAVQRR